MSLNFNKGMKIDTNGVATFSGTIKCDDITGTTITNIKNDITTKETTLKTLISELTTRVSALEGKTKNMTTDGGTTTFSGDVKITNFLLFPNDRTGIQFQAIGFTIWPGYNAMWFERGTTHLIFQGDSNIVMRGWNNSRQWAIY